MTQHRQPPLCPPAAPADPADPPADPLWIPGDAQFPAERFDDFLRFTHACEADDILIKTRRPPVMRIHGQAREACRGILDGGRISVLLRAIGASAAETLALGGQPQDFSHAIFAPDGGAPIRYRVNVTAIEVDARQGLEIVLRRLPGRIRSFDDLGVEPAIRHAWEAPAGTVLINGVPGSGKTWLLAAGTRHLLESQALEIQAYEQPVEMSFDPFERGTARYNASEVGRDVASFAEGLRASLRRAPDLLVVGEVRDRATVTELTHAGDLGLPVFATTHARSCAGVLRRLIAVYPDRDERLERARTLIAQIHMLIGQRLVPPRRPGGWRVGLREWIVFDPALCARLEDSPPETWTARLAREIAARGTAFADAAAQAFRAGRITAATCRAHGGTPDTPPEDRPGKQEPDHA